MSLKMFTSKFIFSKRWLIFSLALMFLSSCAPASAPISEVQIVQAQEHSITVVGKGEIKTTPDFAIINIGIGTTGQDPIKARAYNDIIVAKLLDVFKRYEINEKDIQKDYLRFYASGGYNSQLNYNYGVRNGFEVNLYDFTILEPFVTDVMLAGVNELPRISFKVNKLDELIEQARGLALKDAKQKAKKMAAEFGQQIGDAISIKEGVAGPQEYYYTPQYEFVLASPSQGNLNDNVAFGQVTISSTVTVTFDLK